MPKLSKGYNSGNIVYKVTFPIAIFTKGGGYAIFRGGGRNSTTEKYYSHFSGGGGEIVVAENHSRFFPGELLVADNHSRFFRTPKLYTCSYFFSKFLMICLFCLC